MRLLVLCLGLVMMSGSWARAEGTETVATVREHVKRAAGTIPAASTIIVAFTESGLTGRRTTYRLGDDYRQVVAQGPFLTEHGKKSGQAWHQNENGETVLEQPDPGKAKGETFVETLTSIGSPVTTYVISALNGVGYGEREYVDAASWHVVRDQQIEASGTTTTTYDDYRTTDGATRAWQWTVRDGHPENDAEYRVESETHIARPSDVAISPPRGNFVRFPDGATSVSLPVRNIDGRFYVRLTVAGRGLDFEIDSGSSVITIDEDVARSLGLTIYGHSSSGANAGRIHHGRVILPRSSLGALKLFDVTMLTTPHLVGDDYRNGVRAVGLLGFDFIGAVALQLDYERGTAVASDPSSFVPPSDPHTVVLDVRLGSQEPLTDVRINGALGERFGIDTGADGTMLIFDYFQRRHPEALVDRTGSAQQQRERFYGVGGEFETRPYELDLVEMGNVKFPRVIAYAVHSKGAYGGDWDGLIGQAFLRLFTVMFDYADSRIYLVPNGLGRASRQ